MDATKAHTICLVELYSDLLNQVKDFRSTSEGGVKPPASVCHGLRATLMQSKTISVLSKGTFGKGGEHFGGT